MVRANVSGLHVWDGGTHHADRIATTDPTPAPTPLSRARR